MRLSLPSHAQSVRPPSYRRWLILRSGDDPDKRCWRCKYPRTGIPTDHACPECGLGYDEHTEYWIGPRPCSLWGRVASLVGVMVSSAAIIIGGARGALNVRGSLFGFASFYAVTAIGASVALVVVLRNRCRPVAISFSDGLHIREGQFVHCVIPWTAVRRANATLTGVAVYLSAEQSVIQVKDVFQTDDDRRRLVDHINFRLAQLAEPATPAG